MATGIFCLEGDWYNDFNRSSTVMPGLKLLSQGRDRPLPYVHRDAGTVENLAFYPRRWSLAEQKRFPMLYLAFHGNPEVVYVGKEEISLDQIAEMLGEGLTDRAVHLGCCGTMKADKRSFRKFPHATGMNFATGFVKDVDRLKSTVFEVPMFDANFQGVLDQRGNPRIERAVRKEAGHLARELGFRMVPRGARRKIVKD